jgi:hypothetical protein
MKNRRKPPDLQPQKIKPSISGEMRASMGIQRERVLRQLMYSIRDHSSLQQEEKEEKAKLKIENKRVSNNERKKVI